MLKIILLAVIFLGLLTKPAATDVLAGVATVIDGDTLEIHGTRIRLHGIDAPESAQLCIETPTASPGAAGNGPHWPSASVSDVRR